MRPTTDLKRTVAPFEVISDYQPSGDQPPAIAELAAPDQGGEAGRRPPRRHRDRQVGDDRVAHRAGAAADARDGATTRRSPRSSPTSSASCCPNNAVEYFVSYYDYYQPEAYIPQTDTYIEKDSSINDEVERLRHSATQLAADPAGRRSWSPRCRASTASASPEEYVERWSALQGRRARSTATSCCAS